MRPVEHPPPHADVADHDRAAGVADVELEPAERLEIERLETVDALAADEPRPVEELAVEPAGPAGSCASWHISSTIVPSGASIVKCGQPTICSANSKVTNMPCRGSAVAGNCQACSPCRRGHRLPLDAEAVRACGTRTNRPGRGANGRGPRRPAARPALRFPAAAGSAASAGSFCSGSARSSSVAARRSRCTRAACRPGNRSTTAGVHCAVGLERRPYPSRTGAAGRRTPPASERRYQRLNWPGRCARSIITCHDGSETIRSRRPSACFDREVEDHARLAGRPGAVAVGRSRAPRRRATFLPGVSRRVRSIGSTSRLPRVAGGRPPLDPPAVDRQPVAAVGRDPARRPCRAGRSSVISRRKSTNVLGSVRCDGSQIQRAGARSCDTAARAAAGGRMKHTRPPPRPTARDAQLRPRMPSARSRPASTSTG